MNADVESDSLLSRLEGCEDEIDRGQKDILVLWVRPEVEVHLGKRPWQVVETRVNGLPDLGSLAIGLGLRKLHGIASGSENDAGGHSHPITY